MMGITLGIIAFTQAYITSKVFLVGVTICVALCLTSVTAALVGGTLPLIVKRLGFDPAVMAGPFITTVIDVSGIIIYFETAKYILTFK